MPETEIDRFTAKINYQDSGCWEWSASQTKRGYGKVTKSGGGWSLAHRRSYELFVGPIPTNAHILHKCNNTSCVNPRHLYPGTPADNYRDMLKAGTAPLGERNGQAILTEASVRLIRTLRQQGIAASAISTRLSVSKASVKEVLSGKRWKHVQ